MIDENKLFGRDRREKKHQHAGLEDGHLNLITFGDAEMLRFILKAIGFHVDDTGIVTDKKDEPVTCSGCGCKLTLDEIGYIMPPAYFYCDCPMCICDYFERYGYPDHTHAINLEHPDHIKEHLESLTMEDD